MERRTCSFCAVRMEPGTGKMLVKRDGTLLFFCSSKCENNQALGRIARKVTWVRKATPAPPPSRKAAASASAAPVPASTPSDTASKPPAKGEKTKA